VNIDKIVILTKSGIISATSSNIARVFPVARDRGTQLNSLSKILDSPPSPLSPDLPCYTRAFVVFCVVESSTWTDAWFLSRIVHTTCKVRRQKGVGRSAMARTGLRLRRIVEQKCRRRYEQWRCRRVVVWGIHLSSVHRWSVSTAETKPVIDYWQ